MLTTLGKSARNWNVSRAMILSKVSGRGEMARRKRQGRWANCWQGTQERATSRRVATSVGVKVVGGNAWRKVTKLGARSA